MLTFPELCAQANTRRQTFLAKSGTHAREYRFLQGSGFDIFFPNLVNTQNCDREGSSGEIMARFSNHSFTVRAVPQLPDWWHRRPHLHWTGNWIWPNGSVSLTWQLGTLGKDRPHLVKGVRSDVLSTSKDCSCSLASKSQITLFCFERGVYVDIGHKCLSQWDRPRSSLSLLDLVFRT